jgi:hypothetical protein
MFWAKEQNPLKKDARIATETAESKPQMLLTRQTWNADATPNEKKPISK